MFLAGSDCLQRYFSAAMIGFSATILVKGHGKEHSSMQRFETDEITASPPDDHTNKRPEIWGESLALFTLL